jgi:hypothetical protein
MQTAPLVCVEGDRSTWDKSGGVGTDYKLKRSHMRSCAFARHDTIACVRRASNGSRKTLQARG